jgi:predicted O-linked N-acetylglucosamine transferase (SPINDLY family)
VALTGATLTVNLERARALHGLGVEAMAQNRCGEALRLYDEALQLSPTSLGVLINRSNCLRRLGRQMEALAGYNRALELMPEHGGALCNRGLTLMDLGRPAEALMSFEQALRVNPEDPIALNNRAYALLELRRPRDALASCEQALARNADYVDAHYNRGNALLDLQRVGDALSSFDCVIALQPGHAKAHHNRGNACWLLGRPQKALASFDAALRLEPDYQSALYNRGDVLQALRRPEEAVQAYSALLQRSPDYPYALGQLAYSRLVCCDWTDYESSIHELTAAADLGKPSATPLAFLAAAAEYPAAALKCARTYINDTQRTALRPLWSGERYRHERIRLAYVSADFRDHPVAHVLAGVLEKHDRERFETYAIALRPEDGSPAGRQIRAAVGQFMDVTFKDDLEIATLMRSLEIDIAVDLTGFTAGARTTIFAHRPAPVQVNYLGYPGTMGAPFIDYLIADSVVIPRSEQAHFSERVVYLPGCYLPAGGAVAAAPRIPTRSECGLPDDAFVFCSFNTHYKLNPTIFDIWMRLLASVENAVLWLAEPSDVAARNLRAEAARRGVSRERLIFAPRLPERNAHLSRHLLADLFLDALPFNAHSTAADALAAGLPVLTCQGKAFVGRVASSLLTAYGLPELIASSLPQYEALALQLATTPALLAEMRSRLAGATAANPLLDAARFCRNLETAYTRMWELVQHGLAPEPFAVRSAQ